MIFFNTFFNFNLFFSIAVIFFKFRSYELLELQVNLNSFEFLEQGRGRKTASGRYEIN